MHPILLLVRLPALLAAIAFIAFWIVSNGFDDSFARMVLGLAFASNVAAGSGITGFLLAQVERAQSTMSLREPPSH